MALIKCKECGTDVSSKAETCPKCGVRIAAKPMGCGTLIGVIFLAGIIIAIYSNLFTGSDSPSASGAKPSASISQADKAPKPKQPGSQWSYQQAKDSMAKGTIYEAEVLSSNTVNFQFPYSGTQRATLTLRTHPRYGKNVILSIEKGQFLCHFYEDCRVLVRFDDETAVNYSGVGPADNSTTTVFIRNYNRFVQAMLRAKRVRLSVDVYQHGAPIFEFDVSNFDQNKYVPKK